MLLLLLYWSLPCVKTATSLNTLSYDVSYYEKTFGLRRLLSYGKNTGDATLLEPVDKLGELYLLADETLFYSVVYAEIDTFSLSLWVMSSSLLLDFSTVYSALATFSNTSCAFTLSSKLTMCSFIIYLFYLGLNMLENYTNAMEVFVSGAS